MFSDVFSFASKLQLNVTIPGNAVNQGVSFNVPHVFSDYVTVSAAGLVTPIKTPPHGIMGVIVEATDSVSGDDLKKFVLVIKSEADHTVTISVVPTP